MDEKEALNYVDARAVFLPLEAQVAVRVLVRALYREGYTISSKYSGEDYEKQTTDRGELITRVEKLKREAAESSGYSFGVSRNNETDN